MFRLLVRCRHERVIGASILWGKIEEENFQLRFFPICKNTKLTEICRENIIVATIATSDAIVAIVIRLVVSNEN